MLSTRATPLLLVTLCAYSAFAAPAGTGEPSGLSTKSPLAREAAAAALQALNVLQRRHCPQQSLFEQPSIHSASEAIVGDAVGIELQLVFPDKSSARVLVGRTIAHKLFLFSSSPAACEIRLPLMSATSLTAIEKHNANPSRTFSRRPYKRFEGLTNEQLSQRFFGFIPPEEFARRSSAPLEKSNPAPPASWHCPANWYAKHDGCDCDCGARDPDCDAPNSYLYCHGGAEPSTSRCGVETHACEANVPTWTCDPSWKDGHDGCDCNCGDWDPDCDDASQTLYCHSGTSSVGRVCNRETRTCTAAPPSPPPPQAPPPSPHGAAPGSWVCPASYYNAQDGCDCSCGSWDLDCDISGAALYCHDGMSSEGRTCSRDKVICVSLARSPPPPSPSPPPSQTSPAVSPSSPSPSPAPALPGANSRSFDMREILGGKCSNVNRIRNQGSCGSCWAFAGLSAIEDRFCFASHGAVHPSLSHQEIVSCSQPDGCQGGLSNSVYNYMDHHGVVTASTLPYTSGGGSYEDHFDSQNAAGTCPANLGQHSKWHTADSSFTVLWNGNVEEKMRVAIAEGGPIFVGFQVYEDFMTYSGGVYSHASGGAAGGHAVTIIGWGETDSGLKYWICQNSWGSHWGENGFFRIKRGSNECRIEEWYPSFASPHFGGAAVVPTSSVVGQGGSVQLGIVAAAAPSSSQASSGSGYIALVSASNPNGAPVARVDASSAVDGLASISTAGVAAGSYFVRFCESATSTVASGCTLLDDKIVISHCASTGGEAECSGHGTCGANGACTCDAGYGGNDCSARLCPAMPALKCGCVAYGGVWEQTPDLLQGTPSSSGGGTVLYSLSLAAPATVHLSTCRAGTDVDTVVSIFAGCPLSGGSGAPLAPIAMADDEGCGAESGATAAGGVTAGTSIGLTRGSVVKADLAAGSYVVAVSSANHFALGGFELAVNGCASTGSACAPKPAPVSAMSVAADACAGARPLVLGSQVSGDLSSGHPLLYRLELPSEVKDGSVAPPASALISTCGSAADTELRLYRGCPNSGGALLAFSDDDCGLQSYAPLTVGNGWGGHEYYARVSPHSSGAPFAFTLRMTEQPSACKGALQLEFAGDNTVRAIEPAAPAPASIGVASAGSAPSDNATAPEAATSTWSTEVNLCAGAATFSPPPGTPLGGADYSAGVPHRALVFKLPHDAQIEVDACDAPDGLSLAVYSECAGDGESRPLGSSGKYDGACVTHQMWHGTYNPLDHPSGARLVVELKAGLHTLLVVGRGVKAADVCKPVALEVTITDTSSLYELAKRALKMLLVLILTPSISITLLLFVYRYQITRPLFAGLLWCCSRGSRK